MVKFYVHEKESLETAKAYQTIYDTINKVDDEEIKAKLDPTGETRKSADFTISRVPINQLGTY